MKWKSQQTERAREREVELRRGRGEVARLIKNASSFGGWREGERERERDGRELSRKEKSRRRLCIAIAKKRSRI